MKKLLAAMLLTAGLGMGKFPWEFGSGRLQCRAWYVCDLWPPARAIFGWMGIGIQ